MNYNVVRSNRKSDNVIRVIDEEKREPGENDAAKK